MDQDDARLFLEDFSHWDALQGEMAAAPVPFYLFHENLAVQNIQTLRRHLGCGVNISYAMKANPWIAGAVSTVADFVEVSSPGELSLCRAYGIPGEKLTVDGVWWTESFLRSALAAGVRRFCIDSVQQLRLLRQVSDGRPLDILLRISSGNRFGLARQDLSSCLELTGGQIHGVQFYPGTQQLELRQVQRTVHCLTDWLHALDNLPLEEIEFGAGLGVPCFQGESAREFLELLDAVSAAAQALRQQAATVTYEAGRLPAASCGVYVTEVFAKKRSADRSWLFCRGGTRHLQYPGGLLGVRTPKLRALRSQPGTETADFALCGDLCSEADVLARAVSLPAGMDTGDRIVFYGSGAYAAVEINLLMAMDIPSVLCYNTVFPPQVTCVRDALAACRLLDNRAGM